MNKCIRFLVFFIKISSKDNLLFKQKQWSNLEFIEDKIKTWLQIEVKVSKENDKGKKESRESQSQKQ